MFDVIVDLRPGSETYRKWFSIELTAERRNTLYVPSGCAHGFQTLTDDVEVDYRMSTPYVATASRGFRWDDPLLKIQWPFPAPSVISDRDRSLPYLGDIRE